MIPTAAEEVRTSGRHKETLIMRSWEAGQCKTERTVSPLEE